MHLVGLEADLVGDDDDKAKKRKNSNKTAPRLNNCLVTCFSSIYSKLTTCVQYSSEEKPVNYNL